MHHRASNSPDPADPPDAADPVSALRLPGTILQGILARAALAFLRIYLGVLFLLASGPKLRGDFAATLPEFLNHVALTKGHGFYRDFIQQAVLPNVGLFARLVTWGEFLVGVSLVLGLATRLSATVALVLLVNYMLAKGAWFWYPSSNDAALAAIAVALIIGAAGRTFGLDAMLARRWPRSPFW
jgi:thiosulfate dehydrogenase (quinone) large subunit